MGLDLYVIVLNSREENRRLFPHAHPPEPGTGPNDPAIDLFHHAATVSARDRFCGRIGTSPRPPLSVA